MSEKIGLFEVKDKDVAGRIGKLTTPHGKLETPALLPVVDIVRQDVGLDDIERLGFKAIITNAYLLWKRMREVAIQKGVHALTGFNGIVMTDSGAYQILQYGSVDVDQETIIEFQKKIGSDIAVILDIPTGNAKNRKQAEHSVHETLKRAQAALNQIDPENRIWTLPIQGGSFFDLLEYSAKESAKLLGPYRLVALGSPTVLLERYDYATLIEMIARVREKLPWSIPLHLFGAGHPMIMPIAVALGVDLFDSASYILYARDNRIMTETRTYRLDELDYMPCSTPICTKYTPKELLEMPKNERTRLLALHNLYVLSATLRQIKQAIREGRLWELVEEKTRAHPSIHRALRVMLRHKDYLTSHSPRLKGGIAKGIFLFGPESAHRPILSQHHAMVTKRYRRPADRTKALLLPVDSNYKPFTRSPLYRKSRKEAGNDTHIIGYVLHIGVIPEELAETYPLSQFESSENPYVETLQLTATRIREYLESQNYSEITIVSCRELEWSTKLAEEVATMLTARHKVVSKVIDCSMEKQNGTEEGRNMYPRGRKIIG